MEDLTFGEQVKIILGRKGMTIKQLAELIEVRTGKKMSRQNLTQRLGRDNFQEQDMRMIAEILECPFRLSIMGGEGQTARKEKTYEVQKTQIREPLPPVEEIPQAEPQPLAGEISQTEPQPAAGETFRAEPQPVVSRTEEPADFRKEEIKAEPQPEDSVGPDERDMTIGELYDIHKELNEMEESIKAGEPVEKAKEELSRKKKSRFSPGIFLRRRRSEEPEEEQETAQPAEEESETAGNSKNEPEYRPAEEPDANGYVQEAAEAAKKEEPEEFEPVISRDDSDEDVVAGDVNPYTGREYQSNSVRMHPTRIGYVQVYDRSIHKWTDMTEWAFLGYQERKKTLLGKAYEPPIYLD